VLQCRARRMLNPFRGVMQTIEAQDVDAASIDGQHWGLYITDESVYNFIDLNSVAPFHSADIKYGEWSEKQGLVRSPSLPSMNHERVRERGEQILRIVQEQSTAVPFALADKYERWLVDDEQGLPVVLLESAYGEDEVSYNSNTLWRIGQRARREFVGRKPAQVMQAADGQGAPATERLQSLINSHCKLGHTVWVRREADGHGRILARPGQDAEQDEEMAPGAFPQYGIRQQWQDPELTRLVGDYLHWLSPWLLIMTADMAGEMEGLIQDAVQYPERLYQVRRLLPAELLARKEIKAALVQAELSRSE
jgi:hypothetical protein